MDILRHLFGIGQDFAGWAPLGLPAFLFYVTLVVFIHELGHFLMARFFGAKIDVFSVGFGPEIFGFNDRRGTRWKLSWIPVGGYVKFAGDADAASTPDRAADAAPAVERAQMMIFRPVHQRALVAAAGPLANFVLAIFLFWGLFLYAGQSSLSPVIGPVSKGSAAEAAGLKPGDRVTSIDGTTVSTFDQLPEIIRASGGQTLTIGLVRGGEGLALQVTPRKTRIRNEVGEMADNFVIGVQPSPDAPVITTRYNVFQAFGAAGGRTWDIVRLSLTGIGQLITGRASLDQLHGPVGIAQITRKVALWGILPFISLIAILSVSIGLINLFPIPLLDGGHLLYYACEAILGRPLEARIQDVGFRLGLVLVLGLMLLATWNDIARLNFSDFIGATSASQREARRTERVCRTPMRTIGLKRSLLRSTSAWLSLALLCVPAGAQVPAVGPAPPGAAPVAAPAAGPVPAAPVAPAPMVIRRIQVLGLQRIEASTVLAYINMREGDPYDDAERDVALKALFATGLFSSATGISWDPRTATLTVRVSENPIVNQVVFEGNSKMSSKDLTKEIQIKPRSVFTRAKVQTDVVHLMEVYRRNGRFAARIDPQIISRPQNRVDLIFAIDEGPSTGISRVNFAGNRAFKEGTLRSQIATEESAWYKLLTTNDNYDPERLAYDRELLNRFYNQRGYRDFKVTSAVAQLAPGARSFYVNFTVDEGVRYNIGKVSINSKIPELNEAQLLRLLNIRSGQVYNRDQVQSSLDTLINEAGGKGYAFAQVAPRLTPDAKKRTIDVSFNIEQGPRVYIENINIVGNTRTLDKVIRREFRLVEGDAFNRALVDRSQARIRSLGFFKDVSIKPAPGSQPDRTNVTVAVTETSTGSVAIGVGYSSYSSIIGDISYTETNLFGAGQQLAAVARMSQIQKQFQLSFSEPWFLDRPLSAGFDIQKVLNDYQQAAFRSDVSAASLRFGFPVTEYSSVQLYYMYKIQKTELFGAAPLELFLDRGTQNGSIIGFTYNFSDVDNARKPTAGFTFSLGQNFAGFGGSLRYLESTAGIGFYRSLLAGSVVTTFTGRVKYITGYDGTPVPVNSRYFEGGDTFRGFSIAGIGPRDLALGQLGAIGGNVSAIGTFQAKFPGLLPESYGLDLALFTDFGTVGHVDTIASRACNLGGTTPSCVRDNLALRASAGVSIQWDSPFGVLKIDLGVPIFKAPYDREQIIHFSQGAGLY